MKLLLIEDSEKLQFYLGDGLRKVGYEVDITGEGTEGLWYAKTNDYDAIILDLMLPGLDGLSIVTSSRNAGKETGILILTAKDSIQDRVTGLRMGADDYLTKPFAFDELVARVEALLAGDTEPLTPRSTFAVWLSTLQVRPPHEMVSPSY